MASMSDEMTAKMLEMGRHILAAQPFSRMLGAEVSGFGPEGVELRLPLHDDLNQQHGFTHGGVVAYLADNALTFAGGVVLGPQIVTLEMKLNYIRPAAGKVLIARATPLSSGKRQAVVRCDLFVTGEDGVEKLCAAAQGTIARMPEG